MRIIFNEKTHFTNKELKELQERIIYKKNNPGNQSTFNYEWLDVISKLIEQSKR